MRNNRLYFIFIHDLTFDLNEDKVHWRQISTQEHATVNYTRNNLYLDWI